MRKYWSVGVVLLLCCALSSPVTAAEDELSADEIEEEAQDESDMQRAQDAFDQGARYYYDGQYSDAIVEFRRANQIHPHAIFQHNIALANMALERPQRALEAALDARENAEQLPPEAAAANDAIIASVQVSMHAEDVAEDMEELIIAEAPDVEPASGFSTLGWAGVGTAGVGVLALGGAAVVDRQVVAGVDELENDDFETRDDFNARRDEVAGQQTMGQVMLWSGLGMVAVGGALVAMDLVSGDDGGGVAIAPAVGSPGINAVMRW